MSSPASSAAAAQPQGPLAQARLTIAFFGEVLLALARWLRGRPGPRAADLLAQLDQTGPRSLPIVALSCALIGLMLAYMGGAQLGQGHYWRLSGPTFVIECDNTQNDANHVHTVWRDRGRDFGRDALAEHVRGEVPAAR